MISNYASLVAEISNQLDDPALAAKAPLFVQLAEALFNRRINVFGPEGDSLSPLGDGQPTNWLLQNHPDLYLYGALLHAEFFGWNDERLPIINSAVEAMIGEVNAENTRKRVIAPVTDYTTLVAAIADHLDNAALAASAPQFINLAEAMFTRRLRSLEMESTATAAATATMVLPTGFKGLRSVNLDDYGPLRQLGPDDFQARFADDANTGIPAYYALFSDQLHLGPPPVPGLTVTMTYLRTLSPLANDRPTNWLLESHPDLYLYASVIHAEARGWNDGRLPLLKDVVEGMLAEVNAEAARRRHGGLVGAVPGDYF